ncbi:ABC transporter ATP-binding protein [Aliiroseovarius crassostreae]|uniref:ABC transporter ATP-binding protein n=1 Tax=Aliiroseovarius crassostreae TaxID=154981 RepID=UPI003C7C930B
MRAADLTVENLSWSPGNRQPLTLQPTSFHLSAGRVMGVIGANGAGKTTLLRMIYRYAQPRTGTVHVGGEEIWSIAPRAAARKVAAVLQEQPSDFALSVRDVVALGRIPHRLGFASPGEGCARAVEQALVRMGLLSLAHRSFGTLSGGERQRVMVARALAQDPQVLVLDEPTNHLDIRHQLEVLDLIRGLDMTIVTSLHDLNMAAGACDDILLLQHGRPLGFGPPSDVLTSDLVSTAFRVEARAEQLSLSNTRHFSFHLPNQNEGPRT